MGERAALAEPVSVRSKLDEESRKVDDVAKRSFHTLLQNRQTILCLMVETMIEMQGTCSFETVRVFFVF